MQFMINKYKNINMNNHRKFKRVIFVQITVIKIINSEIKLIQQIL